MLQKTPPALQLPPEQLPEFHTFVVKDSLRELLGEQHTTTVLREVLPSYLRRRRWFAGKGAAINAVSLSYIVPLDASQEILLSEIEVTQGKKRERYLVPAGVAWEAAAAASLTQQLALARVRKKQRVGYITDAFSLPAFARGVIAALAKGSELKTPDGTIAFRPTHIAESLPDLSDKEVRWLSAEQSNSSLILGDAVMLKIIRRVTPGVHPEAEMTRHLTEVGYQNASQLVGEVVRIDAAGQQHTLAIAQKNIFNQGDAWTWMIEGLRRALELAALSDDESSERDPFKELVTFSTLLGKRLGELHVALAAETEDEAFQPVQFDDQDAAALAQRVREQVEHAADLLQEKLDTLSTEKASAETILSKRSSLEVGLAALAKRAVGTLATRVHGDFHLGQVLVAHGDAYLIDFEGEPIRSLEERRAKSTPLRDVAGYLRSLEYAMATLQRAESDAGAKPVRERRQALLRSFKDRSEHGFLTSYWEAVASRPELGLEPARRPLLDLMLIEKAAYEVAYEAGNRPDWLPIPVVGLANLVGRLPKGERSA